MCQLHNGMISRVGFSSIAEACISTHGAGDITFSSIPSADMLQSIITIFRQILWCCHYGQSRFDSSPGSFDECRLNTRWLLTLRPSQSAWAVSPPPTTGRLLPSVSTIAIVIITRWYLFYCPMEGGRLSRPRHCSRGVQPVPKAVYRSGVSR